MSRSLAWLIVPLALSAAAPAVARLALPIAAVGDPAAARAAFRAVPEVASAAPIAVLPVSVLPNDSLFTESWWFYDAAGRHDIHTPEAWDITTGDSAVPIAIIDTGVLAAHPDLG